MSNTDSRLAEHSPAPRVAGPNEDVGLDELALATRNHGMLLEALRYDVTPIGLHYLLVHYDVPLVDPAVWSLSISGAVARPLALTLADLRSRERVTARVTLECAGNGRARLSPRPVSQPWLVEAVGTADWTGTPLAPLLRDAGVFDDVVDVAFTGVDHGVERAVEQDYSRALPIAEAMREEVLLAYEMNGQPLPPQHGFPLRLVIPGWYGMAHVKWLREIRPLREPFDGYQNAVAYRVKASPEDVGEPITWMRPRALMIPPGFPDFMSRTRFVRPGTHVIEGRAWSGRWPIDSVEFSADGGRTWVAATLQRRTAQPWEWVRWSYEWRPAEPRTYELVVRATDASGDAQPSDARWNFQGMVNNLVQRVPVVVLD